MSQSVARTVVFAASGLALWLAGCTMDPGAALIPTPERQATVLPSQAPEKTADGFANILADPVAVAGLPRSPESIAREEAVLRGEAARTASRARAIGTTSSVSALQARGRDHAAEARAQIEAGARPQGDDAARTLSAPPQPVADASAAAAEPPADVAAIPLDPSETAPRAVGVPPFSGTGVAPAR